MKKKELLKNRLDLEYKAETQKAITFLSLGTLTLVGSLTYLLALEKYSIGFALSSVVLTISVRFFLVSQYRMNKILKK